jgi:hypothetical protein
MADIPRTPYWLRHMKTTIRNISGAALVGIALITTSSILVAQTAVESTSSTTTTTSAGTISEFSPDTIVVKTETSPQPVRYTYTKSTTYVDENGAPVSVETVKSGLPVTVYYVRDGDNMVVSKVIVRKAVVVAAPIVAPAPVVEEKKTTTTTTTDK